MAETLIHFSSAQQLHSCIYDPHAKSLESSPCLYSQSCFNMHQSPGALNKYIEGYISFYVMFIIQNPSKESPKHCFEDTFCSKCYSQISSKPPWWSKWKKKRGKREETERSKPLHCFIIDFSSSTHLHLRSFFWFFAGLWKGNLLLSWVNNFSLSWQQMSSCVPVSSCLNAVSNSFTLKRLL